MIIAVDFDGTIVDNRYPKIGKKRPYAIETILRLQQEDQHQFVLWTVREGAHLDEAVTFCKNEGLEFYAINQDTPNQTCTGPRKLNADLFIDDRNLGGMPDWGLIYRMVKSGKPFHHYEEVYQAAFETHKRAYLKNNIFLRIGAILAGEL
jgi:hypothetical protein